MEMTLKATTASEFKNLIAALLPFIDHDVLQNAATTCLLEATRTKEGRTSLLADVKTSLVNSITEVLSQTATQFISQEYKLEHVAQLVKEIGESEQFQTELRQSVSKRIHNLVENACIEQAAKMSVSNSFVKDMQDNFSACSSRIAADYVNEAYTKAWKMVKDQAIQACQLSIGQLANSDDFKCDVADKCAEALSTYMTPKSSSE